MLKQARDTLEQELTTDKKTAAVALKDALAYGADVAQLLKQAWETKALKGLLKPSSISLLF